MYAEFRLADHDYSIAAQIGNHLSGYIDDLTLVFYESFTREIGEFLFPPL